MSPIEDPSTAPKSWRLIRLLTNPGLFLLCTLCPLLLYRYAFQNDTYWLINTGKYICSNGFPHTDPFTFHAGLDLVVQQWLSTLVFYKSYALAGTAGVHGIVLGAYTGLIFFAYRLILHLTQHRKLLSFYFAAFIAIALGFYIVPRPQVFSLLIFLLEITLLERHISKNASFHIGLAGLPLLSILLINFHAAMWPLFFLFLVPYILDGLSFRLLFIGGQGYAAYPLCIAAIVSLLGGAANPYGARAMTYLFYSYGHKIINSRINEMLSPNFKEPLGLFIFFILLILAITYAAIPGVARLRHSLITIGTLYMGISSVRSFSFFILFGFIFLAHYMKDFRRSHTLSPNHAYFPFYAVALVLLFLRMPDLTSRNLATHDSELVSSAHYLRTKANPSAMRLYNGYIEGGYLEFAGIKTFIDSRAELFIKRLNGRHDILQDYFDALDGKLFYADFAAKYSFTHFLVRRGELLDNCLRRDHHYRTLLANAKYVLYEYIPSSSTASPIAQNGR